MGVAAAAVALATGCAQTDTAGIPADALLNDESFVAINRGPAPSAALIRAKLGVNAGSLTGSVNPIAGEGTNDFYIAIKKSELLTGKWFISGFLKQYYPGTGTPADLAVRSLGTRVVSFKVQNGKLFMFDTADGKKTSDVFDPTVLVDAYPVVDDYAAFNVLVGHENYVLFDPSAGMNKFQVADNVYSDSYLGGSDGPNFQVGLAFMQNFRKLSDGVTYEQVFTGNGLYDDGTGHKIDYHTSGTVGIALRKYSEGKGFQPTPYPQNGNYYFTADYQLVPGGAATSAIHWNIQKGMSKKITYYITKDIQIFDQRYPKAHIIDAVKEGVTNWNAILGVDALEAKLAGPDDDIGQDDKNFIIVDSDESAGYAFANWRTNPNTGEIRGASVYLGGVWFAQNQFDNSAKTSSGGNDNLTNDVKPAAKPKLVGLAWSPLKASPTCVMWAPKYRSSFKAADAATGTGTGTGTGATAPDPNDQFHKFITHVVLHEVGHTLGLRHNFKGSLVPPSSSVMDYLTDDDSVQRSHPGDYDKDAIAYLYGTSPKEPTSFPFCTDDGVTKDPNCTMFDSGADPFTGDVQPFWNKLVKLEFKYGWGNNFILDFIVDYYSSGIMSYIIAGDPDVAAKAYDTAMGRDVSKDFAGSDKYKQTVDGLTHFVLGRLFLDPPASRGYISDFPENAGTYDQALADLTSSLNNSDATYSFETRRAAVDILKMYQSNDAYNALRNARQSIAAAKATLSAADQALTDDLLARIDRATSPYFTN
jgi:hypothetical protein